MHEGSYNLDDLFNNLEFPTNGKEIINQCNLNLPKDFCSEISPKIKNQNFHTKDELDKWFRNNLTTHMAGLLGGATIREIITKR